MSEILIFLGISTSKKEVRFLDERLKSKIFKYKDKKDLEKSMEIANKIMKSENKDEIIAKLKDNLNNKNK